MNKGELKVKRLVAVVVVLAIISTLFLNAIPVTGLTAKAAETPVVKAVTAPAVKTEVDFIADSYNNLGADHIFESVTWERLNYILGYPVAATETPRQGTYAIVFGGPENQSTQAIIGYINEVAKDYGVEKVYHFDPRLDGDRLDITNQDASVEDLPAVYKQMWTAANSTGTKDRLKNIDSTYTSNDTYVFVYNKAHVDGLQKSAPIIAGYVSKATAFNPSQATAVKTKIAEVFEAVTPESKAQVDVYPHNEYYQSRINNVSATKSNDVGIPDKAVDTFTVQTVTYPELIHLFESEGDFAILFGGTWCPYTTPTINSANTAAIKNGVRKIYQFDFRLDGASTSRHIRDNANKFKYLYGDIINKYLTNLELEPLDNGGLGSPVIYNPGGNPANEQKTARRIGVPFFFEYSKDNKTENDEAAPVVSEWIGYQPFKETLHAYAWYQALHLKTFLDNPASSQENLGRPVDVDLDDILNDSTSSDAGKKAGTRSATIAIPALSTFFAGVTANRTKTDPWDYTPTSVPDNDLSPSETGGCGTGSNQIDPTIETKILGQNGNTGYDVKHYDITAAYTEPIGAVTKGSLKTRTVITATASENLRTISFDLRDLDIDARYPLTVDGKPATYTKINDSKTDTHKIILTPADTIVSGAEFVVSIVTKTYTDSYKFGGSSVQGLVESGTSTGATAIGEPNGASFWFPSNNNTTDKATYTVTLVAPSNLTGVSVGNLTSKVVRGTSTVRTWEQTQETLPYLVFASFGNYIEFEKTITLTDGTKIPSYSYVDKSVYSTSTDIKDKVYRYAADLENYIRWAEGKFGKYPGEAAGFVIENLGYTGNEVTWNLETVNRPVYAGVPNTGTFVHEILHQWFGDSVSIADWKDLWLNEGFATFLTNLYFEDNDNLSTTTNDWYAKWYEENDDSDFWGLAPADPKNTYNLFGNGVYGRGSYALGALRVAIGDENFFKVIKEWATQKAGQSVTTKDFTDLAKEVSHINLNDFFQTWLYNTAKPATFATSAFSAANITIFSINGADVTITGTNIAVKVPVGTDIKTLIPNIAVSDGADYTPKGAQDFTNPVTYTVTAQDGTAKVYTVTVTVNAIQKSSEKDIKSFKINGVAGKISGTNITVTLAYGTNIKALKPVIELSAKASSSPVSGILQDFSKAVNYTVTAENGSKKVYKVIVNVKKPRNGWIKNYYYKNDKVVKNAWVSKKYRTDATGKKITNKVIKIDKKYFKLGKTGAKQVKNILVTFKGKKYYVNKNGAVLKRGKTFKIGKKIYKANKKTGAIKVVKKK